MKFSLVDTNEAPEGRGFNILNIHIKESEQAGVVVKTATKTLRQESIDIETIPRHVNVEGDCMSKNNHNKIEQLSSMF